MRHAPIIGVIAASLALPAAATEYPSKRIVQGELKSRQCVTCHGMNGVSANPTVPTIAGQNAGYLMIQLHHFKEGKRYDERMTPVAQSLSEEDMDQLVAYFSGVTGGLEEDDAGY